MSIPPDSLWRGSAAAFPQPVGEIDMLAAQALVETVYYFNCYVIFPPLADIVYRSSDGEEDTLRHVFRWDRTPIQEVFQNGFEVRRQANTSDRDYYDLEAYVNRGGRPLDSRPTAPHVFVSTTLDSGWHPSVTEDVDEVYRYEIYAPGGIWVNQTLGDRYRFPGQSEVCFIAAIAPQYIRSAQRFRLRRDGRYTRRERLDNVIRINRNFNPQSHPVRRLNIQRPISYYKDTNGTMRPLNREELRAAAAAENRLPGGPGVDPYDSLEEWYAQGVANYESYINAAFRSSRGNEAYLFMKNEYVLINYAPGSTNDKVLNGPLFICDGYPSLIGTAFGEHGIDCAFGSHDQDEAYIFSGNLCAHINFAPGTLNDKIIRGPMTISAMFPFFKRTVFSTGIDAAFEAGTKYEAYVFKGDQYALINYSSGNGRLIHQQLITAGFPSLRNTIFANGIEAAFASHRTNEAYLFKGSSYALINFAPGSTNDFIIGGVKDIVPNNWPSLQPILPRKNPGLDLHDHSSPTVAHDDL